MRRWTTKADADPENARLVLEAEPGGPMEPVAFHPQQCAEKYLEALLCFRGDHVPRIHDIEAFLARTGLWGQIEMTLEESRLLTDYATVTRDPVDYEPVSHAEADHALELAGRVRVAVRRELPHTVLRRR